MRELSDTGKFKTDAVVGVHYGGMGVAADIARRDYVPLLRVQSHYVESSAGIECKAVEPEFSGGRVEGRRVLIVDNSIRTGNTLELAKLLLQELGALEVRTVVLLQRRRREQVVHPPDYVLFDQRGLVKRLFW